MNFVFDLDGTLIFEDTAKLYNIYFTNISKRFHKKFGIDPEFFTKSMYKTMKQMESEDGSKSIGQAFNEYLSSLTNISIPDIEKEFELFYNDEYDEILVALNKIPVMNNAVKLLKAKGHKLIVATDPFLPKLAVDKKISQCDLNCGDFDFISYNSNCNFVKGNESFFKSLFQKQNLSPADTIVVGNTIPTDIPNFEVKHTFIIKDFLKEKSQTNKPYTLISCKEFLNFVETLCK